MILIVNSLRDIFAAMFQRLGGIAILLALLVTGLNAQTQSSTDGFTPSGLAPGAPGGSYALSGFDNINLATGSLNFGLPLLTVGGRGEAQYTMFLKVERHWVVNSQRYIVSCYPSNICTYDYTYYPNEYWWEGIKPGYGAGVLQGRQTGVVVTACPSYPEGYQQTLTRLTFTAPDGTESELRDTATNGQVLTSGTCSTGQGPSRGNVFVSTDASSMTFISDTPIYDTFYYNRIYPTGYLMTRNGKRYRIESGIVKWIRDRNGNQLTFAYDAYQRVISITDSLARQVTVTYADNQTQISFKGSNGVSRTIRVGYDGPWLRSDYPGPLTYAQAFPELNGSSRSSGGPTADGPTYVELPNGQRYQLAYNQYGELARVALPTGGAYEYDWGAGSGMPGSGALAGNGSGGVYRRVLERRVYASGGAGSTYDSKTTIVKGSSGSGEDPFVVTRSYGRNGQSDVLLARTDHYFYGSAANSIFSYSYPTGYPVWSDNLEYRTDYFGGDGAPLLRQVTNSWQPRVTYSWASADPRLTQTVTTLADTNQVTKQTFGYDDTVPYNNQNNVKEYDFGSGAPGPLVRETRTTYLTAANYTNTDVHLRSLPTQVSVHDTNGAERARATYEYDNYVTDTNHASLTPRSNISGLCVLITSPTQCDNSNPAGYVTRGDPTATTRYLLTNGSVTSSISAYAQYDVAGNVVKTIDARGFATTFDFSDRFGWPDGEARGNSGSSELNNAGQQSYAFPTLMTNALGHTAYAQYEYYLGRPVDVEDTNGSVSSAYSENDLLDRPTKVIRAANLGASVKSQTTFNYDDVNHIVTTTSDQTTYNDNALKSQTLYDGLGRTTETLTYEGGSNYIKVQQQYDALGRAFKTSNPFRPWQNESPGWTTTGFDPLGRVISVTTSDNAVVNNYYNGNQVLVKDQAGKERMSQTNALGQLSDVWEITPADDATEVITFPNQSEVTAGYRTKYEYDTLSNLITVTQRKGTAGTIQTRTFAYNSLSRLTSATNPESGTINYQYDNNGNLTQKTDARPVTTNYAYDALNRNTDVSYSDGTIAIVRVYDNTTNGKGRLSWQYKTNWTNVGTLESFNYDALGRITNQNQQYMVNGNWTPTSPYTINRSYDLAGHVTAQSYPSGRSVSYTYDGAGRTNSFAGNLGGTQLNYATGIIYSSLGGVTKEQFGTDTTLYNKSFYNSRGQLSEIRVSTSYTGPTDRSSNRGSLINWYGSQCGGADCNNSDNNGNLKKQEFSIPDNDQNLNPTLWNQQYDYDSLNRLQRVHEYTGNTQTEWQQEYVYDRWGNRTIHQTNTWGPASGPLIPKPNFGVNTANNNRLTAPAGYTMSYDNAGNLNNDTYTGQGQRTFDAENRMIAAQGGVNGSWQYYTYNAAGQRVSTKVNGVETWMVYGIDGELVAEYPANGAVASPQKEYGYRNGQLLVQVTAGTSGWGPPPGYTPPDPLVTGWEIKLEHLTELRSAVNQLRAHAGLSAFNFTVDPNPERNVTTVKAEHIRQLRTALEDARWHLGLSTGGYAHPTLTENSSWIYAIDFQELRNQIASAWNSGSGAIDIRWLVTDQLGTPRMIIDKTGALANVKRHDYLPFGEELLAYQGFRTPGLGYAGDNVRQKFTRKERDIETGLDYFGYRYYGSVLGRWTSTDPLIDFKRSTSEPQAWNQYQYCINNPLNRTDPDGRQDSLELQTTRDDKELLAGRMSPEVYVDRQQKRGIGAAIGAGIVIGGILVYEAPAIITAMVSWMTRNPNTVDQLAQDAVQMSTGSPAPASVPRLTPAEIGEFGTSIANSVKTGGSRMAGIAARVSECGLSQAEAVGVTQSAVKGIGLESVAAVQKNGTVIVASVMAGTNKPVLIVNQQGVVSQGIATIKAGIRKGTEFFEVSNVVPK